MRNLIFSSSSSSSCFPSTPSKCFHGSKAFWTFLVVLVPILLVYLLFFNAIVDSHESSISASSTSSSWFSSFSSNYSFVDAGGTLISSREEEHHELFLNNIEGERGEGRVTSSNYFRDDDDTLFASLPPSHAPSQSPMPEPENISMEAYRSKEVISLPGRTRRNYVKLERLELGLARARATVKEALRNQSKKFDLVDSDYMPQGPVYRNARAFYWSYKEMEKLFRVYVYEEGEPPLFHDGPCRSIYSTEGRFIHNMEMENRLRTRDPDRAHVHFLPFSVVKMVKFIYQARSFNTAALKRTIIDYVSVISTKYPYWNRSLGADHFMLSCHDWGPDSSRAVSHLYSNSIRVLCNANTSEGFHPSKDVTLPEINLKTGLNTGIIGGPSASHRPILAFFAGGLHGPIRPVILKHWKGKDDSMQIYEYLPKGVSYYEKMKRSKFCICPSGYEVASPRIVEAIYLECVPVIISDHYVLPFSDVLNWKAFSVNVSVEDIPKLKEILMSISSRQ